MEKLNDQEKKFLTNFARCSIENYLKNNKFLALPSENQKFQEPRAVFVTLTLDGELRGCIGTLEANLPLIQAIRDNAINAATEDPRFIEITLDELPKIKIEISILSESQSSSFEAIEPGVDGVILKNGVAKATYLPSVWEHFGNDKDTFLASLAQKAGLEPEAYRDKKTQYYTYQTQVFEET